MTHELIPAPVTNVTPWRPSPNGYGWHRFYRRNGALWVQHVDTRTQYVTYMDLDA